MGRGGTGLPVYVFQLMLMITVRVLSSVSHFSPNEHVSKHAMIYHFQVIALKTYKRK